jgi:hypothetical protein
MTFLTLYSSQIDISHVLAETIRRSHYGESVSVLFNQVPYDTTQPYRHGQDTPGRSVPASPERSGHFPLAAYNQPDPPSAANYFADENSEHPSQSTLGVPSEDMHSAGTPTLHSSSNAGLGLAAADMGERKAFTRPDQTPKPAHAQARGI